MTRRGALALLVPALLSAACMSAARIKPGPSLAEDRARVEQDLDLLPAPSQSAKSSGSLWTDAGPGAALARDTRAFRINDQVTIVVLEQASGQNAADTQLNRASDYDFGASVALGLEDPTPTPGKFNLGQVLKSSSDSKFAGDGATSRSTSVQAAITARVVRVLPNGDLLVAGEKNVTVNRDRQVLTLVGTVRPVDINSSNRVSSAQVGDLTVRLWGRGEIDDTVKQGWFMRIFNKIWPF